MEVEHSGGLLWHMFRVSSLGSVLVHQLTCMCVSVMVRRSWFLSSCTFATSQEKRDGNRFVMIMLKVMMLVQGNQPSFGHGVAASLTHCPAHCYACVCIATQ